MDIKTSKNGETPLPNAPQNPSQPADGQAGQAKPGAEMPGHSFADVQNARQRSRINSDHASDRRTEPRPDHNRQQRSSSRQNRPGEREARQQQIGQVQNVRRRRRHRNYIIYYILLGTIMTIVCITLSLTVFFNIAKLNPTGSSVYSSEQILAAVNARKGDNLLRLNVGKLESQALETLTSAESVEIKRHFPDQLDIVVTDGEPVLQVSFEGMFYQFTESGRLIGVTETAAVDGQVVVGPDPTGLEVGQYMSQLEAEQQESFSIWRTIRDELYNYSIQDISAMELSDPMQLRIYYQNRIEIIFGTLTDMDVKTATLKAILYDSGAVGVDETGVINMINPDRIYFNNQAACTVPDGAAQPGWNWKDPYSETLEESLYQTQQPEETETTEQQGTEEGGSETTEGGEQGESQTSEEFSSSETQQEGESHATSDGMILPLMPSQSGSAAGFGSSGSSSGSGETSSSSDTADNTSSETAQESSQQSSQPQVGAVNGASGQGSTGSGVGTEAPSVPGISG